MTNPYKYKSVSLSRDTYETLQDLSKTIVPGYELSYAGTITKLVKDKVSNSKRDTINGVTNAETNLEAK